MPHDPELVAETQGWLVKAREDLAVAEHDLKARPPFLAPAVFHAQQATERGFKVFLTWHSTPFRKTHNLEELGEQCVRIDPSLRPPIDRAVPLTKYAWQFRYPGEPRNPTVEEAERAFAINGPIQG
jgi:HEPN domain-containing protein